jgi:hypothetical protein
MYDQTCDGGHPYILNMGTPDDVGTGWCGFFVDSKRSQELSLSGSLTSEGDFPEGEQTWSLTFEPAEAPPHVTAADIPDPAKLSAYLGEAQKQISDAMMPAYTALHTAGRRSDAERLQKPLTQVADNFAGASGECLDIRIAVVDAYKDAEKAWLYDDGRDNPAAPYEAALQKLTAAVARWKLDKKEWEEKFAAAAQSIARDIEPVNKDAAKKVNDLAEKLKTQGCESFGGMK